MDRLKKVSPCRILMFLFFLTTTLKPIDVNAQINHIMTGHDGRPLLIRGLGEDLSLPILVFTHSKMNVYMAENDITTILFFTDYYKTGNFSVILYMELEDEAGRKKLAESIKRKIKEGSLGTVGRYYPDMVRYISFPAFFDMTKKEMKAVHSEFLIDKDGDIIASGSINDTFNLEGHPLYGEIAKGIVEILERVRKSPKISDRLFDLRGQRWAR